MFQELFVSILYYVIHFYLHIPLLGVVGSIVHYFTMRFVKLYLNTLTIRLHTPKIYFIYVFSSGITKLLKCSTHRLISHRHNSAGARHIFELRQSRGVQGACSSRIFFYRNLSFFHYYLPKFNLGRHLVPQCSYGGA